LIISAINTFLGGLNKIKIPDWVPGVGGKGINIPLIPTLAKGGVLKKGQTGFLEGDGAEAVVPLEKNTGWVSKVADLFIKSVKFDDPDDPDKPKPKPDPSGMGGVSALGNIAQTLRDIATMAATPKPETVAAAAQSTENKTVIMNNEFTNQFHGDRAGQQKSAEAMDKAADDATGVLARGLAYAR
jgi:hypothetical protein